MEPSRRGFFSILHLPSSILAFLLLFATAAHGQSAAT
jgi:hypothetical protein